MLDFLDYDDSDFRQSHKIGFVCARRVHSEEGPQVRVSQPDKDDLISDWLAVIQKSTIGTRDFWLPQLGEQVLFSTLPNGPSKGFVHGSFYSKGTPSPTTSEHVRHTTFADGTVIEFDSSNSTFTIDSKGPVNLKTQGPVKLASEGDIELTTQGNLSAKVTGSATVEAPNIRLKGSVEITGSLTVGDGLTAQGATFNGDILVNGNGTATGVWKDSTGSGVGS
jgi:phage baseplate assembly protein V